MERKKVAIIGAGISGVVSGKHLLAAGLDISIYERSADFGGVWAYDDRRSLEPAYPSLKPYAAASLCLAPKHPERVLREIENEGRVEKNEDAELLHAPPGPCYESLMNNVPTPLVQITNQPWPLGTENFVNHMVINQYIRAAAKLSDLSKFTHFNTAVEALGKQDDNWMLTSRKLLRNKNNKLTFSTQTQASAFDAVIVASGHYHTMKIPDIPGLKEWKSIWPDRVHHSKGYRRASDYKNQNVLLIGAGTSSFDIAREIGSVANKVYQSSRGGLFDLPLEFLSPNAQRVGEVSGFNIDSLQTSTNLKTKKPLYNDQPIPFSIYLKDGTALHSIHQVVICTGYHCSVPFLSYLHDDSMLGEASTSPTVLVTDGTSFHNLHKDIFYIPDPTLAFVGIPYYSATFTLFEFQAMAVAAVFAEYADLPIEVDMRTEYERRVAIKGHGRSFHSVKDKEIEYVDDLLAWINEEGAKRGRLPVKGHTDNFRKVYENRKQLMRESLLKRNEQGRIQTA